MQADLGTQADALIAEAFDHLDKGHIPSVNVGSVYVSANGTTHNAVVEPNVWLCMRAMLIGYSRNTYTGAAIGGERANWTNSIARYLRYAGFWVVRNDKVARLNASREITAHEFDMLTNDEQRKGLLEYHFRSVVQFIVNLVCKNGLATWEKRPASNEQDLHISADLLVIHPDSGGEPLPVALPALTHEG